MSQQVVITVAGSSFQTFKMSSSPSRFTTTGRTTPQYLPCFPPLWRDNFQCRPLVLMSSCCRSTLRPIAVAVGAATVVKDAGATAVVLVGAYGLVLLFDKLTERDIIPQASLYRFSRISCSEQNLSRKLVHILSGLLFMVSWPLFRYFASLVPLFNCFRLVTHGLSLATDEGLVKSVTREGRPEELLRGPLYYVLVLIACALVFWRESPVGVIALSMMCGGDGVADIVGRRIGSVKLPYNQHKSWAGSISMFACGFLISVGMLYYFSALGYFELDWSGNGTLEKVALVSLVATIVESLATTEVVDDNISVPLASMLTAYLTFHPLVL